MQIREYLKTTRHNIQKYVCFHPALQVVYIKYPEIKYQKILSHR